MPIRFKLDENVPRDVATWLRELGHDAHTVLDEGLGGRPDDDVISACRREQRVLITIDLDFADPQMYPPASHSGVWVLRGSSQSIESTWALIRGAMEHLRSESPRQRLWIVEHGRVRIRG